MLLQVHYLNKAMAEYGTGQVLLPPSPPASAPAPWAHVTLPQVVPPYYCLFTASAVMGSALLYKDLDNTSTQDMLVFCVSLVCVAIGVALVSKREGAPSDSSSENDQDRDQYDHVRAASSVAFCCVAFQARVVCTVEPSRVRCLSACCTHRCRC